MIDLVSLTNHFLIAMPNLGDPNFSRTVALICEHSKDGAMGLVINRITDLRMTDVLEQMNIEAPDSRHLNEPVHVGGPVQINRGFVVHEPLGKWESTLAVAGELGVSTSRDILEALARNQGPEHYILTLGYAGWEAGQLEHELAENAWLSGPADRGILFHTPPEARWNAAARLLGIDLTTLSGEAGHA